MLSLFQFKTCGVWRYFYEAEETVEAEGKFEITKLSEVTAKTAFIKLLGLLCVLSQTRMCLLFALELKYLFPLEFFQREFFF